MGTRTVLAAFVIASLIAALTGVPATNAPARAATVAYETSGTGLHGGGFINVVAADPFDPSVVLAGGDNSGVSRSTDGGLTWRPANDGAFLHRQRRIATIAFSPTQPGKVYLGVGAKGNDSALFVSEDHGQSWALRSTTPRFSGANNSGVTDLPNPHPRSTGNLIAFDPSGDIMYVATFDGGLLRSDDDGLTWESLGLDGVYLRTLVADPTDPTMLFAGTWGEGVYRVSDGPGAATVEHLAASPATVEELTATGSQLFAATGAGVQRSEDQGETWVDLSDGLPATAGRDTAWMAIDATSSVVVAGAFVPPETGDGYAGLVRSTDGGSTWELLGATAGTVGTTIGGPAGEPWWYAAASPNNVLGGPWYAAAQVVLSPHDPGTILAAGRGGIWRSTDGGATWYPAVEGLSLTENSDVAVDPADPNHVVVANTDWVILHSEDAMSHVARNQPPGGNEAYSLSFAADRLYAAVGHRDHVDRDGEIYSTTDVSDPNAWTDEGLSDVTDGQRPIGVVAFDDPADGRVVLAAVAESGVWRQQGGEWTHVDTPAVSGSQPTHRAVFQKASDRRLVYLFDRGRGVWRSADAGASWERVWRVTSQAVMTGDLAIDPADPARLFVASVEGLHRLDGADSGSVEDGSVTLTGLAVADPGPLAITSDGSLVVATRSTLGPAQLLVTEDGGESFEDVADDRYRGAAAFPAAVAAAGSGDIHITTIGNGNLVVRQMLIDTMAPETVVDSPEQDGAVDTDSLRLSGSASDDVAVAFVDVAIRNQDTGLWWQGDGTWGSWATHQPSLSGPPEHPIWEYEWAASTGSYALWARAVDAAGNRDSSPSWVRFTVVDSRPDTTAPETTVVTPARGQTLRPPVVFSGTAEDDREISSVTVAIRDRRTKLWWHADGTWGSWTTHQATVLGSAISAGWDFSWAGSAPGRYNLWARATDAAGNRDASPVWLSFRVAGNANNTTGR